MSSPLGSLDDARMASALAELEHLILARWPEATFAVAPGEDDPGITHLWATVDVPDTDEVTAVVMDRLLQLQLDERLPIAVISVRPVERVLAEQRRVPQRIHRVAAGADAAVLPSG